MQFVRSGPWLVGRSVTDGRAKASRAWRRPHGCGALRPCVRTAARKSSHALLRRPSLRLRE
eukprot:10368735-Alexandrium_andersonii.AAC.1